MKSAVEELCRSKFDDFLKGLPSMPAILWREVAQQDEPPDYYVSLDSIGYAVEVTTLMETVTVGTISLPQAAIVKSLWGFVDEVEEIAEREGYLSGTYVVGFLRPIDDFGLVRDQVQKDLLDYIRRTQQLSTAPEKMVFSRGGQRCSIQKAHNLSNKVEKLGPSTTKWEGEAATQICTLLEERLADKCHKLRGISNPTILLLYDSYRFADPNMYRDCVPKLPSLASFHTVFIVRGEEDNFVLYSENGSWL